MGQRAIFDWHVDHVPLGAVHTLSNGFGDVIGLTETITDVAVPVTDDHHGGEGEATATLHDLGDAV